MKEILREYIRNELLKAPNQTIHDDESLFQSQTLSTNDFIELTIFIEEQFGTEIQGFMYGSPEVDTINNIASVIAQMNHE
jgi:acyl carrier protein